MLGGHRQVVPADWTTSWGTTCWGLQGRLAIRSSAIGAIPRRVGFRSDRVGAENPVTSRDVHVLVEEAAEPVSSEHVNGRA